MLFRTMWNVKCKKNFGFSRLVRRHLSDSSRSVIGKATKDGELRIFIVSGEVSGDSIGSRLMSSLKKLSPLPIRFFRCWRVKLKETTEAALLFRPHVVVTVDSKGFSFRLLKQLRARYNQQRVDAPVHFHYVAPSFWAWKGGEARLKGLAKFVDHILCILPNEEEVCRANGLAATFVGHPILEDVSVLYSGMSSSECEWKIEGNSEDFKEKYSIAAGATVLSLLPGSRLQEVNRMLTIFANTMQLLQESISELVTVIHVAPNQHVEKYIDGVVCKLPVPAILIPGGSPHLKYDALSVREKKIV